jgi:hypothetical protein
MIDWQVFPFLPTSAVTCATTLSDADWQKLVAPSTGTLTVIKQTAGASTDPCSLNPTGGYTRLENLLYRFEVHDGVAVSGLPTVDGPRFQLQSLQIKLSRRNASVLTTITHIDPHAALAAQRLFRIASATDDTVTLEATPAEIAATGVTDSGEWFLRLWDALPLGTGVATVNVTGANTTSDPIDIGDGLSIQLGGGATATFRRGDYWTCAARADGSIDWPLGTLVTPHGPTVRYAPLAVDRLRQDGGLQNSCRDPHRSGAALPWR